MKRIKFFVVAIFVCTLCMSCLTSYAKYSISEYGITNIDVPENYISCTRSECDEELGAMITSIPDFPTLNDWNTKVMESGKYYVYACKSNDTTKCMYLICSELDSPKTKDGLVSHKLAKDYNLAEGITQKTELLNEFAKTSANMNEVSWAGQDKATPYIEYYSSMSGNHLHVYKTIYRGQEIVLQFSSAKKFTDEEKQMHLQILNTIDHTDSVEDKDGKIKPYKEELESLKNQITSAKQKKLEEESHTGKNTRILWYIIGILVATIIVFSIYMAIRSRSKKKNKIVVLRDYEVTEDDMEGDK